MPPEADSVERPLTPSEVADLFGVSISAVADWADRGQLSHFRTPGGQRRFWRADVEAFIASTTTEAAS